jgi:hypothetical protein
MKSPSLVVNLIINELAAPSCDSNRIPSIHKITPS